MFTALEYKIYTQNIGEEKKLYDTEHNINDAINLVAELNGNHVANKNNDKNFAWYERNTIE